MLYGQSYAEVVTRFVPRAIWPGKPPGIGDETRRIFYPARYNERTGAGVPPSLFGELVWNFHFPGVIVGMMLLGFGVRTSVEYLNRSRQNPWTVLFYALTVLFLFGSIRTYFAALTMRYLIWMLLAFAVVLLCASESSGLIMYLAGVHHDRQEVQRQLCPLWVPYPMYAWVRSIFWKLTLNVQ